MKYLTRLPARAAASAVLCLTLMAVTPASAAPSTLNLEGVVHANGGGPASDGGYLMTFGIYSAKTGGKADWQETAKVFVSGGRFRYVLGATKPIAAAMLAKMSTAWLGVQIDKDPELSRVKLHSVAFALNAAWAANAKTADNAKVATTAQIALNAKTANDLACTGCVSIKELKIDGDLDLGKYALKTAKLTADSIVAKQVAAGTIVGDGSKLTGIGANKLLGKACKKGEVVRGIKADGSLDCGPGGASLLPKDGLASISNGLLTNQFTYTAKSTTAAPIPDNNPSGVSSAIVVGDHGLAQKLTVTINVTNSDTKQLRITLTDPANKTHVLWDKSAAGTAVKKSYPPTKIIKGDLSPWIGKNPKGKWTLNAIDTKYKDNKKDGAINSWSVAVQVVSNGVAAATKGFRVDGHLKAAGSFQFPVSETAPVKCDTAHIGYAYVNPKTKHMFVCNGAQWGQVSIVPELGTQLNPAKSCLNLLNNKPDLKGKDGTYWIKPGNKAIQAICDMTTEGGGYTMYGVKNGVNTCRVTDNNSCKALGMDIVFPRSKAHWASLFKRFGANGTYFSTIPGVYKSGNGGNYTGCRMRSTAHYGSGSCGGPWRVADGGRWWLRDNTYSEPNGDYTSTCWLSMYKWDVNDIRFNDGSCSYCTKSYVCSTNDKK